MFYISHTLFSGIKSSGINIASQVHMIHITIEKMIQISKSLIFLFLLIRLIVHYTQYHWDVIQLVRSCYTSIISLVIVMIMLYYYVDIFNLLDQFTLTIIKKIQCKDLLQSQAIPSEEEQAIFEKFFSIIGTGVLKKIAALASIVTHVFRTQIILFTLQVGPLAIAAGLLPGKFSHITTYWFNMLLSFLMWGVTIALLDVSVMTMDKTGIGSIAATISTFLLYGMIGPLTTIYIGNTIGNSLFSLGQTQGSSLLANLRNHAEKYMQYGFEKARNYKKK